MINTFCTVIFALSVFTSVDGKTSNQFICETDTLTPVPVGANNSIAIDFLQIALLSTDSLLRTLSGSIEQTGTNNSIQISNQKNTKQNIVIKQTGKNNSFKRNSKVSYYNS